MSTQAQHMLCALPLDVSTSLSAGFLFQGNAVRRLFYQLAEYPCGGEDASVVLESSHLTQASRIAHEELPNFLEAFQACKMAAWEVCLPSEGHLFPVMA